MRICGRIVNNNRPTYASEEEEKKAHYEAMVEIAMAIQKKNKKNEEKEPDKKAP